MILKAIKYFALSLLAALLSVPALAATYYLSPTGNNSNSGTSEGLPWKTFAKAFSTMAGGDELILLDGTYSVAAGTGYISYLGTNSDQPPNGSSTSAMTYIHAKNPGSVNIVGALFLGRSTGKNSYIKIQGITFDGGASGESTLYNTSYIYIKDCGFYGTGQDGGSVFGIGTNDGNWGNTYNLIEDVWIWGKNRIIASNYRANNNIWRRVLVRGDGCNTGDCTGSGNPNVGITVYNSKDVSLQNVIVVDRILGGGSPYADFATAQHDPGPGSLGAGEYLGPNEWLGTISLKSPDVGYYFEADDANNNTGTLRNVVAWISADDGINIGADYRGILLENITAGSNGGSNIRVAPAVTTGTVRNIIAYNASLWGVNSAITPSYVDVYGAGSSNYNQTSCSVGCKTTNPIADGTPASLKYITRIETGSALKGTGYGGGDYGANIVNRYGADGTFYGQSNYNALTANALWPWPNEARIKSDLCATSNRGFCLDSSLTHYILNTLGNGDPYSGGTTPVLSNLLPTSNLARTATSATLQATTDQTATCRYALGSGTPYAGMTPFSNTASTTHSSDVSVVAGGVYQYCVRCMGTSLVSDESCTRFAVDPNPKKRVRH